VLTGKKVSLTPYINSLTEGLNGSSTPSDFETMMQLAYLYFENPRFDKEAHKALMSRYKASVKNMQKNPRKIMQDSLSFIWSDYHPRTRTFDNDLLEEVDFEEIKQIYQDRIKDASDFIFFIVGNIDEETAKTMSEKYIGALTTANRDEKWKDHGERAPDGLTEKTIPLTLNTPKTHVNIRYVNEIGFDQKNKLMLNILRGILNLRYIETIREEEGGSYGVGVNSGFSQYPVNMASLMMSFDCEPARGEELKAIIYREIEKIIKEGPTSTDFENTVINMLKNREQAREHNSFWMNALYNYYYSGINTALTSNYEDILENLSREEVWEFSKTFFLDADVMDVVFVPEN
jgi:zinc protease